MYCTASLSADTPIVWPLYELGLGWEGGRELLQAFPKRLDQARRMVRVLDILRELEREIAHVLPDRRCGTWGYGARRRCGEDGTCGEGSHGCMGRLGS